MKTKLAVKKVSYNSETNEFVAVLPCRSKLLEAALHPSGEISLYYLESLNPADIKGNVAYTLTILEVGDEMNVGNSEQGFTRDTAGQLLNSLIDAGERKFVYWRVDV